MRKQIWIGLVALNTLALTVDCGGDGTSGGSGGTAGTSSGGNAGGPGAGDPVACPADITDVPAALAEAICRKRTDCCEGDQDTCLSEVVLALDAIYPDLDVSEQKETAALSCTAFDACALAIHGASCEKWPLQSGQVGGLPVDEPQCLAVITPSTAAGDDCSYNYECINGLCRVPEGESEGTCSEFANLGASCDDALACDPTTMFCNAAQVCQTRLPDLATCTESGQCESRICDLEAGECIPPGADECEYVPNGTAHCAVGRAPGSGSTHYGLLAAILAGVGVSLARRQRAERSAQ